MGNKQQFLVALGGNMPSEVGSPGDTLRAALQQLERMDVTVEAVSPFYQTPCFPPGAGPDYVNATAILRFSGAAADMLQCLHDVEADFGRERVERWGRRTLDLDLIAAGQSIYPDVATYAKWRNLPAEQQAEKAPEKLILPHPRLQDRAFVLVPLADIAPGWCHPVSGLTVKEMLDALPDKDKSEVIQL